jgi:hypothetical protein
MATRSSCYGKPYALIARFFNLLFCRSKMIKFISTALMQTQVNRSLWKKDASPNHFANKTPYMLKETLEIYSELK